MTVRELLLLTEWSGSKVVALDGKTGKILFDTSRNKLEYYSKYEGGKVSEIWADFAVHSDGIHGSGWCQPYIKCFVSHKSWEEEGNEPPLHSLL